MHMHHQTLDFEHNAPVTLTLPQCDSPQTTLSRKTWHFVSFIPSVSMEGRIRSGIVPSARVALANVEATT